MGTSVTSTRKLLRPNPGWKPGQSGNPNGRPKADVDIAAMARQYGPECIDVIADIMRYDPDKRLRLAAATTLMDRGFGRPTQQIVADPALATPILLHLEAARAISEQLAKQPVQSEPVTIDAVVSPSDDKPTE